MPVEIRELVIRAEVAPRQADTQAGDGTAGPSEREQIVRDCVEQVMELLRQKEER